MTAQNLETFTKLVTTAQSQFLKDEANRRLQDAQNFDEAKEPYVAVSSPLEDAVQDTPEDDSGIVTTEEEIQAFNIIRAITCAEVSLEDVVLRDAKSYCAILYQDNNRKPIARLWLDRKVPRIVIFDADKNEQAFDLSGVVDIYQHADLIRERCRALRDM